MRILGAIEPNTLTIHDKISNEDLELYYRTPTTKERVNYFTNLFKPAGSGKYKINTDFKLKTALDILVGIGEEQFGGPDGKPISSNPKSPYYTDKWKTLILDHAGEILSVLADVVFDNLSVVTTKESLFVDPPTEEETPLPLEPCSTDSPEDVRPNVELNV